MDGFYDQVNAMNQIDFILAANNTAIMQPFSAHTKKPRHQCIPVGLVFSIVCSACVSQKQQQNRA